MSGEIGEDPTAVSPEEILARLKKISDTGAAGKFVIDFRVAAQFAHVNKLFLSEKRTLCRRMLLQKAWQRPLAPTGEKQDMIFRGFSGLKGAELLDEIGGTVDELLKLLDEKLHADPVVPGMYDVITAPEVTGLIAHEAFGHGVEMDMFVKERALAKEYLGKKVASDITSMKDGAASAAEVSSYLFDDEGTLGTDTTIIENGTLVTGISDLLSALRLGTAPTGNGKEKVLREKPTPV
ncbi:MAG: metallopeptidase TldD-related protein [Blautia sp.]